MTASWHPPTDSLQRSADGIWLAPSQGSVSYPEEGNDSCFAIEDESYWFTHRNRCLVEVMSQFPPAGLFYDIGGGNGFVAAGLEACGFPAVIVEPGSGARNARRRGLARVIQGTLEGCGFAGNSIDAMGAFDVVEHIEDEEEFLNSVYRHLKPGGRFYVTVPAIPLLWSAEDVLAGHFRRYTEKSLRAALVKAGFEVRFLSPFFSWLVIPVALVRALPWRFRSGRGSHGAGDSHRAARDHSLPLALGVLVDRIHSWERKRLGGLRHIPFGTSLLAVAEVPTQR